MGTINLFTFKEFSNLENQILINSEIILCGIKRLYIYDFDYSIFIKLI